MTMKLTALADEFATAIADPRRATVGDFARIVGRLHGELNMLEPAAVASVLADRETVGTEVSDRDIAAFEAEFDTSGNAGGAATVAR